MGLLQLTEEKGSVQTERVPSGTAICSFKLSGIMCFFLVASLLAHPSRPLRRVFRVSQLRSQHPATAGFAVDLENRSYPYRVLASTVSIARRF